MQSDFSVTSFLDIHSMGDCNSAKILEIRLNTELQVASALLQAEERGLI